MEIQKIQEAIKKAREGSKKRNFTQSFDLFINLKELNLKKTENQIEEFIQLPKGKGKEVKICAFIDKELISNAKKVFNLVIPKPQFDDWVKEPKKIRKLVREYDFFVAQAKIMVDVAKIFGKYLAPKGKLPSPKAGCIIVPKARLEDIPKRLSNLIILKAKKQPTIHCLVGTEKMKDEDIAANTGFVVEHILNKLPKGKHNIKSIVLKLTMGPGVRLW